MYKQNSQKPFRRHGFSKVDSFAKCPHGATKTSLKGTSKAPLQHLGTLKEQPTPQTLNLTS